MTTEGKVMAAEVCQEVNVTCMCARGAHEGYHACSCGFVWTERTVCGHDPDLVCPECIKEPTEAP